MQPVTYESGFQQYDIAQISHVQAEADILLTGQMRQ